MASRKKMDPVEEFIEMAVRHLGAHHGTGPIHDPDTHKLMFQRGSGPGDWPAARLTLPSFAHLKHGPTAVEEAKRLKEIEKALRGEFKPEIEEYVRSAPDTPMPAIKGGSRQYFEELLVPVMTAAQSAVTGTTETALWPVSPFSATVANQLQPGQKYDIKAAGLITTASSAPGTLTLTPRWGTSSGGVAMGASGASATLTTSKTNVPWYLDSTFICRGPSTSAATAVWEGLFYCDQAGANGLVFGGTIATIDTTTAQGFYMGVTLGSASDSMTVEDVSIVAVN